MNPSRSPRMPVHAAADGPLMRATGGVITWSALKACADALAGTLAGASGLLNLCDRRPEFMTAFVAALRAGVTTVSPSARAPEVVAAALAQDPARRALDDAGVMAALGAPAAGVDRGAQRLHGLDFFVPDPRDASLQDSDHQGPGPLDGGAPPCADLDLPGDTCVLIGHTSGSTGEPTAHRKTWGSLRETAARSEAVLRAALPAALRDAQPSIVATVPPQHMYGMELTVLLPLFARIAVHAARPLLAPAVIAALDEVPHPRILVSTPTHLRAIVSAGGSLPAVDLIVSATAPMDRTLATAVEAATGGVLLDLFGSTETCLIGYRRITQDERWTAYPGVRFLPEAGTTRVEAPWFDAPQILQDVIESLPEGRFEVRGRHSDFVDVAGKRASLADLTRRILAVPGVIDAALLQPPIDERSPRLVRRVAALVVAPGLTAAGIRAQLVDAIDPVFMPRPLLLVPALPREPSGKLPRQALETALAAAGATGAVAPPTDGGTVGPDQPDNATRRQQARGRHNTP